MFYIYFFTEDDIAFSANEITAVIFRLVQVRVNLGHRL